MTLQPAADMAADPATLDAIETASRDEIEALQRRIAEAHGYRLVGHRLELYGVPIDGKKKAAKKK